MRKIVFTALAGLALAACSGQTEKAGLPPASGTATEFTQAANAGLTANLPFDDTSDFDDARRGLIAQIEAPAILGEDGNVVWDIKAYDFLDGPAPDTVNPSLWRQSQLAAIHGLFEVTEGVWQVRGYDLAVMSIIEGETGWIIVDPLTASETAAAALKLVNETLGERPVTGVIYTHSHADHFGGARGVISETDMAARNVPVIAPAGFSEAAVSENLLAGNLMSRRSVLMFGNILPRTETGHVGSGLGPGLPQGTIGLILPSEEIPYAGGTRVIDGVTFEFIDAAGTEAPAEFMFYLPEKRALCTAEVATKNFHNVLTPRGAKVRDALYWSQRIDKVLVDYGDRTDVVFASHHWPTWGAEASRDYLARQRDIYRYVHDQTLRLANAGATQTEAAEAIAEPSFTREAFDVRSYYGTLNHNSKAVYQYYYGWWDGIPAKYHALPEVDAAPRYVAAMGGAEAALRVGGKAFDAGEYRWAAEVFNHVVFAAPENKDARNWLAASYEQLGFQAESGAWRSYYLTAAQDLRSGAPDFGSVNLANRDFLQAVPTEQLFDAMASRFNPEKMTGEPFVLQFRFQDTGETIAVHVGRSVIVPRAGEEASDPAATVTTNRYAFNSLVLRETTFQALVGNGEIKLSGDPAAVGAFFLALDTPPFWFNVAEP